MKEAIDKYVKLFGEKPNIIGMFWYDQNQIIENIENAIKSGKKYNELDLLTEKEKESYLKGDLVF